MHWQLPTRVLTFNRSLVMGIVNVTPDSFSDGGKFFDSSAAIDHAKRLIDEGADILDIGGESTRPGAPVVPVDEELRRVLPVVQAIAGLNVPISIDTSKAEVARQCLDGGAAIVNDVTALLGDEKMPDVVQQFQAACILMHMQGTPQTMQQNPQYADVVAEVDQFFKMRLQDCESRGIAPVRCALDPGIGFGKTDQHSLSLLADIERFTHLGRPVCLGVSRKGMIGRLTGRPAGERLIGGLALACDGVARGAVQIVRTHDVAATRDAVVILAAIRRSSVTRGEDPGAGTAQRTLGTDGPA